MTRPPPLAFARYSSVDAAQKCIDGLGLWIAVSVMLACTKASKEMDNSLPLAIMSSEDGAGRGHMAIAIVSATNCELASN